MRKVTLQENIVLIPGGFTNPVSNTAFTTQNTTNAYHNADNTSYNRMTVPRTSRVVCDCFYEFDVSNLSNIPENAVITSVTARVKYYVSSTSYVSAIEVQLYSGSTAKGSAVTTRSRTASVYNITAGTWTLEELENAKIYVKATRSTNTRSNVYVYFYGADITVNYEYETNAYAINSSVDTDASLSETSSEVIAGNPYTLTIIPNTAGKSPENVFDNGADVTNLLVSSGNNYQYTINSVNEDHVIEVLYIKPVLYDITLSGSIPSSLTVDKTFPFSTKEYGNILFNVTPTLPGTLIITDNGNSSSTVIQIDDISQIQYSITNVTSDHIMSFVFVELPKYQITTSIDQDAVLQYEYEYSDICPAGYVYENTDYIIRIIPNDGYSDPHRILDNNTDTTNTIEEIEVPYTEYSIESVSDASYGFEYDSTTGYYTSTNHGASNSAAVCYLQFTNYDKTDVIIKFINYAESPEYDYGIIGTLDGHPLDNTYQITNDEIAWSGAPAANNSANEQTYTFSNVAPGTHTIYFKYRKDAATNSYNDDFRFKVEFNGFAGIYYKYKIENVATDHNVSVIYYATTYNINITNNSQHIGISAGNTAQCREGHIFILEMVPSAGNIGIIVTDNNVQQNVIPVKLSHVGRIKRYIIDEVNEIHTLVISERALSTINCFSEIDNTTVANVYPASVAVIEGDQFICGIFNVDTANHPKAISVSDNYIDVTSYVNYVTPPNVSETFTAMSYTYSNLSANYRSNAAYPLGKTAENPNSTSTTNYVRVSRNNGYAEYSFSFDEILEEMLDVDKENSCVITCSVYGKKYSATNGTNYAVTCNLYSNTTQKATYTWPNSTTAQKCTFSNTGTWTLEELENAKLRITIASTNQRFFIGGISLGVQYQLPPRWKYSTQNTIESHTIRVRYVPDFYTKMNNSWVPSTIVKMHPKVQNNFVNVKKMFVKVNNQWKQVNKI